MYVDWQISLSPLEKQQTFSLLISIFSVWRSLGLRNSKGEVELLCIRQKSVYSILTQLMYTTPIAMALWLVFKSLSEMDQETWRK